MTAVEKLPPADLKKFYVENLRPVTNLYEQSFFLSALQAMQKLAQSAHDPDTEALAWRHYEQIVRVLESRHWDEKTGFYYDWDVTGQCLVQHKNQDAFYLLQFLTDKVRAARLVEHLKNPKEFGLRYTPTLAADDPGFKATGYWCGGYWPREAAPISLGLAHAGYKHLAIEFLVKAICSGDGKIILENVNPITGRSSTPIVNMAYSSLLPLTLKQIQNP
jgi:hypothetical protein